MKKIIITVLAVLGLIEAEAQLGGLRDGARKC